jgi:hypothetical protein
MSEPSANRCGHVAIVGRPNVGKSTLLNRLIGQKLAITSRKPQTTRHSILGVKSGPGGQVIYVDTPGIHRRGDQAMNRYLNRTARNVIEGVDLALFVVEALRWNQEDEDVLVSPHFTLGQLLCKDPGDPRYLVLSIPLVLKLEAILAAVNRSGIRVPTLQFVSGYRTPAYNRAIGNTTTMSRHLYGDAADIYVDSTGDGKMDDLNKDGRVDTADALALVRIIEGVERADGMVRPGGVGLYPPVPGRGPFVHVDARGTPARW